MTPEEWFAARDPRPLIDAYAPAGWTALRVRDLPPQFVRGILLLACAFARQGWYLLSTDARSAIQIAERFADGRASQTDVQAARIRRRFGPITAAELASEAARIAFEMTSAERSVTRLPLDLSDVAQHAARAVATRTAGPAPPGRPTTPGWHAAWNEAYHAARAVQADYVRDLFPPPGLVLRHNPPWLTTTVMALAREMDGTGDYSAMPILADALEEAGCETDEALRNCRSAVETHIRGNWVIDWVLGRGEG